jgi:hypothetical protein
MEQSIKKVASIQGAGTYESPHGLLYSFDYSFDDGSSLRANHKSQASPFNIGDEVEVVVKGTKEDFSWGNVRKPQPEGGYSNTSSTSNSVSRFHDREELKQQRIMSQWAIRLAMEWEMNQSPPDRVNLKSAISLAKQIKSYALDLDNVDIKVPEMELEAPY